MTERVGRHAYAALVWPAVSSGGIVSFDDYGDSLPDVTRTVHALIGEHGDEIDKVWTGGKKTIFIRKRARPREDGRGRRFRPA